MPQDHKARPEAASYTSPKARIDRRTMLAGVAGAITVGSAATGFVTPAHAQATAPLFWLSSGASDPVFFIHGAGGNASVWFQQIDAFRQSYRTVAFDLRGYGASPDPDPDFSPANLTADVVSVLDAAGVDRAVLVCQSLGGWAGLRTALEAPERVRGLVLCNTMAGVAHMPALQALGQAAASVQGNIPSLALTEAFVAERPDMAHLYRSIGARNRPNDPEIAKRFTSTGLLPPQRLAEVVCPTLMIAGENDPIWPPAAIQPIAEQIPNSRFEVISGSGHSPYFETPAVFNKMVMEFISSIG